MVRDEVRSASDAGSESAIVRPPPAVAPARLEGVGSATPAFSAADLLALQEGAGNAVVCRMLSRLPSGRGARATAGRTLARLIAGDLDFRSIAQRIHEAINGLGTDEEAVYAALQQLDRDASAISTLKTTYKSMFGEELEDAIRGDFSDEELQYALQLLGGGSPSAAQRVGGTPSSPADFDSAADRIHAAVTGLGTDEEAIFAVLRPLNRDPDLIDRLAAAYSAKYHADLVATLQGELSGGELQYAEFLLRRGPSPGMTAVSQEAESMVGQQSTWTGSSPGSGNTFEAWASAASEGAAPPVAVITTINCWEMLLLAAYRANHLSWQWIHDQYTAAVADWSAHMVRVLSRGARIPYTAGGAVGRQPVAGDLVFMDGINHVALATGTTDATGRAGIISFWPPPNTTFTSGGTVDDVKHTTIEELVDWWTLNMPPAPLVELAAPPWS